MLVSVEELFNVVELVSVEDASSARFSRYGMKINILECCRFSVREPSLGVDRNNSEFSPILITCISTTSENHNSFLVEMQEERYISLG